MLCTPLARVLRTAAIPAALCLAARLAIAQPLPPEVEAVRAHILGGDYPELFKDKPYRTRIENALVVDLDGDGQPEVVLHFNPHFRQSAPIQIFRVATDMAVTRVREGLAPGALVPPTGQHLDSHVDGMGVDFDLQAKQGSPIDRRSFVELTLAKAQFGGLVEYRNFFHADARRGPTYYVDMTHIADPPSSKTCESFEFSLVKQVAFGTIVGLETGNLLAAWAGSQVFAYRIEGFTPSGLLRKKLWKVTVPDGFRGFVPPTPGPLRFTNANGEMKEFVVRCTGSGDGDCTLAD